MRPTAGLMTKVDDDLALVPAAVVALEVGRHGVWGVCVLTSFEYPSPEGGGHIFRPAAEDSQESARELLTTWIRWANTGEEQDS